MSAWSSGGMDGHPGVDFQRQKRRNPWRCQRRKVSGCTTARASRQLNQRASQTRARRVGAVVRRGVTWRSWYSANCVRRNRFSAVSAAGERRESLRKCAASQRSISIVPVRDNTLWSRLVHRVMATESLCSKVVIFDYYPCCEDSRPER
jgi:hypothetical protein